MNIFLDDLREFPKGDYQCVRTYSQCVMLLSIFKNINIINLDYDLGTPETGYDVLVYMKEHHIYPNQIVIHSSHIEGCKKMEQYIKDNFPNSKYYRTYSE